MRFNIFPEITSEKCAWILNTCDPDIQGERLSSHTHTAVRTHTHPACALDRRRRKCRVHVSREGLSEGLSVPRKGRVHKRRRSCGLATCSPQSLLSEPGDLGHAVPPWSVPFPLHRC